MYCPQCDAEYKDNVQQCADCKVDLVPKENRTVPRNDDDLDLVHVFSTRDPGIVALAKSLLDEAKIPAMVRNESLQDLFGFGRVNFNPISGDVDFFVNADDREAALELLAEVAAQSQS